MSHGPESMSENGNKAGVSTRQFQATSKDRAAAIVNSIQFVTKEIPPEDVDVTGATEAYKSRKTVEGFPIKNELLCLAESRVSLIGETKVKKFSE